MTDEEFLLEEPVLASQNGTGRGTDSSLGTVEPSGPHAPGHVLATSGVDAGYGDLAVLRNLEMALYPGEVVALLGSNGSGKTTTLVTLAGVIPPIKGEVYWLGKPCSSPLHVRARQGLAFIPEERSVIMGLTARDNLRVARADIKRAVTDFPELESLMGRRAGLMSGGEQQMLTIGRAVGRNPAAIVVDEISLGLAPIIVERLVSVLRRVADNGAGVLVVDQNVRRALAFADRFYFVKAGRVRVAGRCADYRDRPEVLEQLLLVQASDDAALAGSQGD